MPTQVGAQCPGVRSSSTGGPSPIRAIPTPTPPKYVPSTTPLDPSPTVRTRRAASVAPAMSATAPATPATVRRRSSTQNCAVKPESAMAAAAARMDDRNDAATPKHRATGAATSAPARYPKEFAVFIPPASV